MKPNNADSKIKQKYSGITSDSRKVVSGGLFAALQGLNYDGTNFIAAAIANGAKTILIGDHASSIQKQYPNVNFIITTNPRAAFAKIAADFYSPLPRQLLAVTGTNGKTSTTYFVQHILQRLGISAGRISTTNIEFNGVVRDLQMTTPNVEDLSAILAEFKAAGIDYGVFEASSHALSLDKLVGLSLSVGAITNLTHDHLDYHGSFANYLKDKLKLFSLISPDGVAVVNADMLEFAEIATVIKTKILTYGDLGNLKVINMLDTATGMDVQLQYRTCSYRVSVPFIARFQLDNLLCAVLMVMGATNRSIDEVLVATDGIQNPPGRLDVLDAGNGRRVYIDYAHTPDALENILRALSKKAPVTVVFGCGGERDSFKRPMMGAIAAQYASVIVVTDDNPRQEDPAVIRAAILAACPNAIEIADRAAAIKFAIDTAPPETIILIAGKGHETYQQVGKERYFFSDYQVSSAIIRA